MSAHSFFGLWGARVAASPAIIAAERPNLGPPPEPTSQRRIHRENDEPDRNHPKSDDGQEADKSHGDKGEPHGDPERSASRQVPLPSKDPHFRHRLAFISVAFLFETGPEQMGSACRLSKNTVCAFEKALARQAKKPFCRMLLAARYPPSPGFSCRHRIFLAEGALQTGTALLYAPPPKLFRDSSVGRAGDC